MDAFACTSELDERECQYACLFAWSTDDNECMYVQATEDTRDSGQQNWVGRKYLMQWALESG